MERKLATIRRVSEVLPIGGADRIELVKIDGWQCIAIKNEFKAGELGVYFEIDSFLPIQERFEFLRKSCYKKMADGREGFRIKTMRLRGVISQGLLLPLSNFPEIKEAELGKDYSELLGVVKYEPPMDVSLSGIVKGVKPSLISKTDQERIQNLLGHIEKYREMEFEVTEKLDGTSAQFYYNGGEFGVCSRNLEYSLDDKNNAYVRMADGLKLEEKLAKLGRNVSLQGEIVGEKIQKNYLQILGQQFYVFDVWEIDKQCYLSPIERREFLARLDGVKHVPTPCLRMPLFKECDSIDKLLEFAKGKSMINPQTEREGVVCKSYAKDEHGNWVSFKIINNDYLLKHEE